MATRRERVVLELEDQFSARTLRAAAAAKTLDKALDSVDRTSVRTTKGIDSTGAASSRASTGINQLTGRLALFRDVGLTLGPALIPISAVAIPAVTTLASQMGAAAIAGGTMVVAFQGVGTALEAVNKAALEPTADNLREAELAMSSLAPEAARFVAQIQDMRPAFAALRDAAAGGLFPGLSAALADAEGAFDRVETVLYAVGDAAGDLAEDFAEGLAGPRGQEFLDFIATEVPGALTDLGHTVGNLAAGMAELWMAFTPTNNKVSDWLLESSRSFDDWATNLSQTDGFQSFIDYLETSGPQVADALGAIGNALIQVVQAAAPLGGPALAALEAFANVVAAIAGSSYGPTLIAVASGLALISRSMKVLDGIKGSAIFADLSSGATGTASAMTKLQRAGVGAGLGLAAASVAAEGLFKIFDEDLPGLETLTGSLIDLSGGRISSLGAEFDSLGDSVRRITDPLIGQKISDTLLGGLGTFAPSLGENRTMRAATAEIEALDGALSNLANTGGADAARDAFATLAQQQGLTVDETRRLLELLPGYTEALARAANEGKLAGNETADGFERATSAAQEFKDAVTAATRALEGRASVRDYEQAIDDLTKSVKENGRSLDVTTQKGRDNQAALDAIAQSALGVAQNMRKGDRERFLTAARADMIDAAMKLGKTRGEAAALADRLLGLDKIHAQPRITVEDGAALSAIAGVAAGLTALNGKTATTYIRTVRTGPSAGAALGVKGSASGENYIPGQRWPYGDKVLRAVAPGEAIITNRNGEADANRDLIRAMNAGVDVARQMSAGSRSAGASRPVVNVGGTSLAGASFVLEVPGMGRLMTRVVEASFGDQERHQASRARTFYGEVEDLG